jgi:hypothetical protein
MPSPLADAAGSLVFWVVLLAILSAAVAGYVLLRRPVGLFSPTTTDSSKVLQDWLPTGRIDFTGPTMDPAAADSPATFYLQAEEMRLLISMSGIERREIRWRKATFNEAKRVVGVFHRQLPKSALRALEKEPFPEVAAAREAPAEAVAAKEPPPEAAAVVAEAEGPHPGDGQTAPVEEHQAPH